MKRCYSCGLEKRPQWKVTGTIVSMGAKGSTGAAPGDRWHLYYCSTECLEKSQHTTSAATEG